MHALCPKKPTNKNSTRKGTYLYLSIKSCVADTLRFVNLSTKRAKSGLNANTAPLCFFKRLACDITDMDFWPEDVHTDFETNIFPGVLKQVSQQTHNINQKLTTHIN